MSNEARPSTKMYGLTHNLDGSPRIIEPKTVKVGIGLAKGSWIHVYIDLAKKWVVQVGKEEFKRFDSKLEARKFYRTAKQQAPERKYPQRLSYFTFSHVSPDGSFEPEWEAIESHGPLPTEVDIVFMREDSFSASYQMWTATEKKCDGDGINALRVLSMASTPDEKRLAAAAQQKGEKYFPILDGCWTKGCNYSKPQGDNKSLCAPHGRLQFQLFNAPRLGGTAYFDSRGWRSVSQIFSCLQILKGVTGSGNPDRGFVAGIPLKMILRPYKTVYNGKSSTQYGVSLEYREKSAVALKKSLVQHGVQFLNAAREPLQQLVAAPEVEAALESQIPVVEVPESAVTIEAEFDRQSPADDGIQEPPPEEDYGDVAPELARCWEDEEAAQPAAPAPLGAKADSFYQFCRNKGMTDAVIINKVGQVGYEELREVPDSAFDELMKWAEAWVPPQPKQGSLV